MRLRTLTSATSVCLFLATAGLATPGQDIVTASLQAQGFEVTLVHWTLLGRIRIIAVSADTHREIVINPNTGEILRDYSQRIVAMPAPHQDDASDSASAVARTTSPAVAADLDASAVSALEKIEMSVAPTILTEDLQN